MNKKKKYSILLIAIIAVLSLASAGVLLMLNGQTVLAFKSIMPEKMTVNEVVNMNKYIHNPSDKAVTLTATYEKDGKVTEYPVTGLSFTPQQVGETTLTVKVDGSRKQIEKTVQIVGRIPIINEVLDASYFLDQTVEFEELLAYIDYDSVEEAKFVVEKLETNEGITRFKDESSYTFTSMGDHVFFGKLRTSGGSVNTRVTVSVTKELTEKEEKDLTNTVKKHGQPYASIALCEDDHANNSDWSWEITANPETDWSTAEEGLYYQNRIYIDFKDLMQPEYSYFTMNIKKTKDVGKILFRFIDEAGKLHNQTTVEGPHDQWFEISSENIFNETDMKGLVMYIMHPEASTSTYDVNNVKMKIDNCFVHERNDYIPTANKIVPTHGKAGTAELKVYKGSILRASYLQMEGNYANECFEFTTTMTENGFYVGARLDEVTTNPKANSGIVMQVSNTRIAYYAPKLVGKNHKGNFTYSTYGMSNLELGKDYTFRVWVNDATTIKGNDLIVQILDGDTVLGTFEHETNTDLRNDADITTGVPKKGSFAVWNMEPSRKITYKMPYKAEAPHDANFVPTVNKVVASNEKDGVTTINVTRGTLISASYLQMKGNYTNECFEFSTKVTEKGFYIGARLDEVSTNAKNSKGIVMHVSNTRIAYYAPSLVSSNHKGNFTYSAYGASNLEIGKDYTFKVWVTGNNLIVQIKDGDTILGTYSHEGNADQRNGGDITTGVPKSGSFAVWNMDTERKIAYKMPHNEAAPKIENTLVNKVVPATGSDGTANIQVSNGAQTKAAYLQMQGDYANEYFEFTTKFVANSRLYIGARMDGVTSSVKSGNGIILMVNKGGIAYYAPTVSGKNQIGTLQFGNVTLEEGKEYTFIVGVQGSTTAKTNDLFVQIKQGDTVLGTYKHSTNTNLKDGDINHANVPDKGSFAVWSLEESCDINYKMPYEQEPESTEVLVKKVVPSTDTQGGTANIQVSNGAQTKAAYLQIEGDYANENFEFTTTFTGNSKLYIGVRRSDVEATVKSGTGITLMVNSGSIAYYSRYVSGGNQIGTIGLGNVTLEEGKAYTFIIRVEGSTTAGTNDLVVQIKDGDTILGTYRHSTDATLKTDKGNINHTTYVPDKGSFVVWSLDETRDISYKMPYVEPTDVNVTVPATSTQGGTATIKVANGSVTNAAYLNMQGAYTTECFEFTTTYTADSNLYAGARVTTVGNSAKPGSGIILWIKNNSIPYYTAHVAGAWQIGTIQLGDVTLEDGKEYTFIIQVTGSTTAQNNDLIVTIKDGDSVLGIYKHSTDATSSNKVNGNINSTYVPDSGSFAVWSLKESRNVGYKMPYTEATDVNVTVPSTSTQGGSVAIKIAGGSVTNAAYLNMQGEYTTECFEFTTTFTADSNLYVGARVTTVGNSAKPGSGIILWIKNNSIPYYTAHVAGAWQIGTISLGDVVLEDGKEYTFIIQVTGSTTAQSNDLIVTIKEGDTVLGTFKHSTDATSSNKVNGNINYVDYVPDSGSFAVWSLAPSRIVRYEMPYTAPATTQNLSLFSRILAFFMDDKKRL